MILAGIDIGTNTLRLLIAEVRPGAFREISSDRRITRLGQDLVRTGSISPEAQERSAAACVDFSAQIRNHAVRHIAAVGTSALRKASNSREFIDLVKRKCGLDVRVITGEEEARLTLLGVRHALGGVRGDAGGGALSSALVVDIGGGSTEVIIAGPGVASREVSLPLGAVYLTERFIRHDPPTAGEAALLREAVREELGRIDAEVRRSGTQLLAGTAGTITTLAAMDQKLPVYDPDRINGSVLDRRAIDGLVGKLSTSTLRERRSLPGLELGREDIILAGAVVAQEIMARYGFATMTVSDWGLREGLLFDLFEKTAGQQ